MTRRPSQQRQRSAPRSVKMPGGKAFAEMFCAKAAPEDLATLPPLAREKITADFLRYMQQRQPGKPKLRIYKPDEKRQGWSSKHNVLEIVNDDMPFLVDSITGEINRQGLAVHLVLHPILNVVRLKSGKLQGITAEARDGVTKAESCMHIHFDECADATKEAQLLRDITRVLLDVRYTVNDWKQMRTKAQEAALNISSFAHKHYPSAEINETTEFLNWLADNNYTFLGYRELKMHHTKKSYFSITKKSGLGIFRNEKVMAFTNLGQLASQSPLVDHFLKQRRLLLITSTNRLATVHRTTTMDAIFVPQYNKKGQVVSERLFVGLFTSASQMRSPREVPILRKKIDKIIARSNFLPASHDGKALTHILDTYPRAELFQTTEKELYNNALGILHLQERQRVALFTRNDPFGRYVTCLVYVPRDRYDTHLRERITGILQHAYNGSIMSFNVRLDDSNLARLFVIVATQPGTFANVSTAEIEAELHEISRAWSDRLRDALNNLFNENRGMMLYHRYGKSFSSTYRESVSPDIALRDVTEMERLHEGRTFCASLTNYPDQPIDLHLKLYSVDAPITLSDAMPIIENMGLQVKSEGGPYEVKPYALDHTYWIHDFVARTENGEDIDLQAIRPLFEEAFAKVWHGQMDNDGFNRLILLAGLNWREVTLIRALARYLQQIRAPHSLPAITRTLRKYPRLTRLIIELFVIRHNPALQKNSDRKKNQIQAEIRDLLAKIPSLDEDRIIRRLLNLVRASLRTNYFQTDADGNPKPCLSIKFDCSMIDGLPLPRPMYEIFVHGREVEAVHLRGGKVARGGIRWSDREDFRTEILGLVKAQNVKNTVIVPVGAKGGFIVRRPRTENAYAHGTECYKSFVRSMLDITDNQVNGKVVPPKNVVRHDGDDPYLVVAADKGTAKFSDTANAISADYKFWLGDAFASGGSVGYDHKEMAITARGAWEAVKRHFREIGKDIQKQDFTCIGVGDMSGDVFGNGMLLSKHIRLIGAFDHRHIFCDPNPDAARSFDERHRLFEKPSSSWDDYNRKMISKGGGVFSREEKIIRVSPEMRAAYDLTQDSISPNELIVAMLKANTELLYFGGIGTYVKASFETHEQAGDRVNEPLRIDGKEIRAKVVAEGANLGMTQYGRIEYALQGGRINTDAIDNSAGVDTSDHEVNIKIALSKSVAQGKLKLVDRNKLLRSMTKEVAGLVLRDNYLQTQAISFMQGRGHEVTGLLTRMMRLLEKNGLLNRKIEQLPDEDEIAERIRKQQGFTRPELAVLMAYAKIWLFQELLPSALPDDPFLHIDLVNYFPTAMQKPFHGAIMQHQLRREIIATAVTNSFINRAGMHTVFKVMSKTGRKPADITMAYLLTRDAFELRSVWKAIEGLDNKVPAALQNSMMIYAHKVISYCLPWFLRHFHGKIELHKQIPVYQKAVRELQQWFKYMPRDLVYSEYKDYAAKAIKQGVPADLAERVAMLPLLAVAPDIAALATGCKCPVPTAAEIFYRIDQRFNFSWLRNLAAHLPQDTQLQRDAVSSLSAELFAIQGNLAAACLRKNRSGKNMQQRITTWLATQQDQTNAIDQLLGELRTTTMHDIAGLSLIARQLTALTGK